MTGTGPRLSGLVCEDDPEIGRAIVVVMSQCGFESVTVVRTGQEAVESATRTPAQAAVIDLALAGARGVGIVADVVRAAPGCKVVAVSPFSSLRPIALAAGAISLCELSDLRQLQLCLKHALEHAESSPEACDCHGFADLWPPVSSRSGSFRATTTVGSSVARYQPWSPR